MKKSIQVELELISELYSRREEKKERIRGRAWGTVTAWQPRHEILNNNNNNNNANDNATRPKLWSRFLFFFFLFFFFFPRIRPTPGRIRDARQTVAGPGSFRIRDTRYWATPGQIGWDALQQFFYSAQRAKCCARRTARDCLAEWKRGERGGRGLGVVIGRRFLAFIRVGMKSWKALPLISALIHLLFLFFEFSSTGFPKRLKQAQFPLCESFY